MGQVALPPAGSGTSPFCPFSRRVGDAAVLVSQFTNNLAVIRRLARLEKALFDGEVICSMTH